MAEDILLSEDVYSGYRLLEELRKTGFPMEAAFWHQEDDCWRFYIVTPLREPERNADPFQTLAEVQIRLHAEATAELPFTLHSARLLAPSSELGHKAAVQQRHFPRMPVMTSPWYYPAELVLGEPVEA